MSWLVARGSRQHELAAEFLQRLEADEIFVLPGAHDPISALIAQAEGFHGLYLSGAAYSASRGLRTRGS